MCDITRQNFPSRGKKYTDCRARAQPVASLGNGLEDRWSVPPPDFFSIFRRYHWTFSPRASLSLPLSLCFSPSRSRENWVCLKVLFKSRARIHSFSADLPSSQTLSVDGDRFRGSTLWSPILSGPCRRRIRYANSEWSGGWELHRKMEGKLDSFLLARFPKCHGRSRNGWMKGPFSNNQTRWLKAVSVEISTILATNRREMMLRVEKAFR